MQSFEIVHKVLSLVETFLVRSPGSDNVVMTIKGKVIALLPKVTMVQGTEGVEIAKMRGNYFKTKFTMTMPDGKVIGVLKFPLIAFKKSFSLSVGDVVFTAKGGVFGVNFSCVDANGKEAFTVRKEAGFRDRFAVDVNDGIAKEVAIFAAIAIDQKYFPKH
jgi:uncharacterized protein YxjI